MQQPSLAPTRQLLRRAALGLSFHGETREQVSRMMIQIEKIRGLQRLSMFLSILDILSSSRESRSISSSGFSPELNPFNQERMNNVFQFINSHLADPICLEDVARLLHLSTGAFSRLFRRHTARTFPEFVNELRIGRACRLLAETEMTITEIAMASGFTNLSNFNRQFMRLKKLNPRNFRNKLVHTDL
ncbi:MAG: hypothetical protein A2283_20345 [Lentisphaerae bacterium RIFOXYA12_FULL_48_11]|nr:MAG: hypothetical protein A2283_20345 [Lentisphaerae bacterium RIFOXYA12_FULL_48_11]